MRNKRAAPSPLPTPDFFSARPFPGTFSIRSIRYSFNICLENSRMHDGRFASRGRVLLKLRGFFEGRTLCNRCTALQMHILRSPQESKDIPAMLSLKNK